MKKLLVKALTLFITLRTKWRGNLWHYRSAVQQAIRRSKVGGRYYVFFLNGKYHVFNRKDIQRLKNKKVFQRHANTHTLAKICLFDTLDKVNRHPNPKYRKFKV